MWPRECQGDSDCRTYWSTPLKIKTKLDYTGILNGNITNNILTTTVQTWHNKFHRLHCCMFDIHKSLNKSVSMHGHRLSDLAYSKYFNTLRSHFSTVNVKIFFLAHDINSLHLGNFPKCNYEPEMLKTSYRCNSATTCNNSSPTIGDKYSGICNICQKFI